MSLREEVENARRECEALSSEVQSLKIMMRTPDRREWMQINRELQELQQSLDAANKNIQKLEMEKFALESDNARLKQEMQDTDSKLSKFNNFAMPKIEETERLQKELLQELKQIRTDADLLPGMFRNEAQLKINIREEKLRAEEMMEKALAELEVHKARADRLEHEKNRKERIALQAIGARNSMETDLKKANAKIKELEDKVASLEGCIKSIENQRLEMETRHSEMQNHTFVLNNRINELEDQKKVLLDQLRAEGKHSKAHFTIRKVNP
jgi:chromosome segregation ATPase